jgi:hypothetical protein
MSEILACVPARSELSDSASVTIGLDEVESPAVRMGIGYWARLCNGRPYPARIEISPRDIRTVLRDTLLIRVLPQDYEFRIVGDAHVMAYGFSMLGRKLCEIGELAVERRMGLRRIYDQVCETGEALALRSWVTRSGRDVPRTFSESAFLPLGETQVDHILVFSTYSVHQG